MAKKPNKQILTEDAFNANGNVIVTEDTLTETVEENAETDETADQLDVLITESEETTETVEENIETETSEENTNQNVDVEDESETSKEVVKEDKVNINKQEEKPSNVKIITHSTGYNDDKEYID